MHTKISFYLKSNGYILNNNNNVVSLELSRFHVLTDKYIYNNYTYKLKRNKNQYVPHFFRCLR